MDMRSLHLWILPPGPGWSGVWCHGIQVRYSIKPGLTQGLKRPLSWAKSQHNYQTLIFSCLLTPEQSGVGVGAPAPTLCWVPRYWKLEKLSIEYISSLKKKIYIMECGQTYNIQNIARLYFLMNKVLINLRSKKNMGPSLLTGLGVQWQCNDNEDLCHHNWDGSMKYSFITRKKYPLFTVVWCAECLQGQQRRNQPADKKCLNLCSYLGPGPGPELDKNVKMKNREGVWDTFKKTRIWCIMLYTLWVSQRSSSVIWPLPWGT